MSTGAGKPISIKEHLLHTLGMFWDKLKTTYVTSTSSNAGNNLALAASAGYNLQQQINTINSKFIFEEKLIVNGNGNNYVYVPQSNHNGYELISATNGDWDYRNLNVTGISHQGALYVIWLSATMASSLAIKLNLLWIKKD